MKALLTKDFFIAFAVVLRVIITGPADVFLGRSTEDSITVGNAVVIGVVVTCAAAVFDSVTVTYARAVSVRCHTAATVILGRCTVTHVIAVEHRVAVTHACTIFSAAIGTYTLPARTYSVSRALNVCTGVRGFYTDAVVTYLIPRAWMHIITFWTGWALNGRTVIRKHQVFAMAVSLTEHIRYFALRIIHTGTPIADLALWTFTSSTGVKGLYTASVFADELAWAWMHVIAFWTGWTLHWRTVIGEYQVFTVTIALAEHVWDFALWVGFTIAISANLPLGAVNASAQVMVGFTIASSAIEAIAADHDCAESGDGKTFPLETLFSVITRWVASIGRVDHTVTIVTDKAIPTLDVGTWVSGHRTLTQVAAGFILSEPVGALQIAHDLWTSIL